MKQCMYWCGAQCGSMCNFNFYTPRSPDLSHCRHCVCMLNGATTWRSWHHWPSPLQLQVATGYNRNIENCLSLPRNQTSRKPREVVGLPLLTLKAVKIQLPPLFRSFPGQPSGRQRWPFVTSYILWNSVIHCWFLYKLISSRIRSRTMQANTNTRH